MKLTEIAERIKAHLQEMEADKNWNLYIYKTHDGKEMKLSRLYHSSARIGGLFVLITYITEVKVAVERAQEIWPSSSDLPSHSD